MTSATAMYRREAEAMAAEALAEAEEAEERALVEAIMAARELRLAEEEEHARFLILIESEQEQLRRQVQL